ncbi:hypothetical protein [Nitrosomonas ureae]|uniref:Uncharacterized protein n=1 Tax=Nitrosomonas ureae TaxID=44577 RepID=A0A1H9BWS2_9PROT|nr:hypothetical protein [Nitrosomonas ureae]SEP93023.1 hypothetical protein SAMN05421510_10113 [Nitrosomonas ureae]
MNNELLKRIEKLQRGYLARLDYDIEDYLELNTRLFESIETRISNEEASEFHEFITNKNPITGYQARNFLWALRSLFYELSFMFKEHEIPPILLATLFSGKLTGQVLYSKKSGYAVVIDEALLMQSGILSKVLVETLVPSSEINGDDNMITVEREVIHRRIQNAQYSQSIFNDCLVSYIAQGSASFSKYTPLSKTPALFLLYECLTKGINQFVVAHEIGHILAKHFESDKYKHLLGELDISQMDQMHEIPIFKAKQLMECEADWRAFEACIDTDPDSEKTQFRLFGMFAYLYFLGTLSSVLEMWVIGRERFEFHYGNVMFEKITVKLADHFPSHFRADILCELLQKSAMAKSRIESINFIRESARVTIQCLWENFMLSVNQDIIDKIPISNAHKKTVDSINQSIYFHYNEDMTGKDIEIILGVEG